MDDIIANLFSKLDESKWSNCSERTPNSKNCVECLHKQYFDENEINYSCVEKRKLYVIRYLPVHTAENRAGFKSIPSDVIEKILDYNHIRILSIGGGPGSDIYAALDFLSSKVDENYKHKVYITRIDIEPLWDKIATHVINAASDDFEVSIKTLHEDVIDGLDRVKGKEFDIIVCSYLISELNNVNLEKLGQKLRALMWNGGVIVVNDRSQAEVEEKARTVFRAANIEYSKVFNTDWAGFCYPEEIVKKVGPKLNMRSTAFWGVKCDN
ncbi:hypothetical protein JSY17_24815 [Pseudomonas capsici]|uniref:hypothetical protein n=1 Tax=Pseudomonas capsici TaxID=2810614 RepID=UPI0019CF6000|nr:hypothetical protein [Pseudomonas capsici]MBN6717226.1 hypothetical protein [Pseudomonas capsici]MBN6722127.1 hypothetical protein [Pseudomonas capsici]MBN6727188.1 hypothetical protein [Pseudomonas capsici]